MTSAIAYNRGLFTDSDRFCPNAECGKRLVIKDGMHECLSCDYLPEPSSALIQPVSIREAVATVTALRGHQHRTTPCPRCYGLVIETETVNTGAAMAVDAVQVEGGKFIVVAMPDGLPRSSSQQLRPRRSGTLGYRKHACGQEAS